MTRVAATILLIGLCSCTREKEQNASNAASVPAVPSATGTPPPAGMCPRTGHWGECQVRAKLDLAGLAPRSASEKLAGLPDLGVKPIEFMIGNAGLAFYVFADTVARHKAGALLDPTRFIAQSQPVTMRGEATLIQNDNAIAILFSNNEHQRERVFDTISGGAPQP